MEPISEELVEETWQEVSDFAPQRGAKEVRKLSEQQPDLLAFILEFSDEFDQEVKELALYLFVVVHRMFQKAYGKPILRLDAEAIMECFEKNQEFILSLENAHDRFYDRIARVQISAQPFVMKYIADALFEPDEDDPIDLNDDNIGMMFLLLKTVVDLLNEATEE